MEIIDDVDIDIIEEAQAISMPPKKEYKVEIRILEVVENSNSRNDKDTKCRNENKSIDRC